MDHPSMREMTIDEYKDYVEDELFHRNHHDVLTLLNNEPIACTKEQIEALIEFLQEQKSHMPYAKDIL